MEFEVHTEIPLIYQGYPSVYVCVSVDQLDCIGPFLGIYHQLWLDSLILYVTAVVDNSSYVQPGLKFSLRCHESYISREGLNWLMTGILKNLVIGPARLIWDKNMFNSPKEHSFS